MSVKNIESFAQKVTIKLSSLANYAIWVFILLLVVSTVRNIGKVMRIREEIKSEKQRISKMEAENQALQAQVAMTLDPQFVETEIRNKLGLVKEGETIVVLPDNETLRKLAPTPKISEDLLPPPIWKKWVDLFAP